LEDGRATDVFLTSDGGRLVERLYSEVQQALGPLTSQLQVDDQRKLQQLLRRMLDAQRS
jgi:DNA-binding MarR family transcriptional regulator